MFRSNQNKNHLTIADVTDVMDRARDELIRRNEEIEALKFTNAILNKHIELLQQLLEEERAKR